MTCQANIGIARRRNRSRWGGTWSCPIAKAPEPLLKQLDKQMMKHREQSVMATMKKPKTSDNEWSWIWGKRWQWRRQSSPDWFKSANKLSVGRAYHTKSQCMQRKHWWSWCCWMHCRPNTGSGGNGDAAPNGSRNYDDSDIKDGIFLLNGTPYLTKIHDKLISFGIQSSQVCMLMWNGITSPSNCAIYFD